LSLVGKDEFKFGHPLDLLQEIWPTSDEKLVSISTLVWSFLDTLKAVPSK